MQPSEYHIYLIERLKSKCPYYTNILFAADVKFIIKNSRPTYHVGKALIKELEELKLIERVNRKKIKIL